VLRRIQERSDLEVHISLNTVDVALIRHVEARSPMPAVRLRALERLANAGVRVGLIVAPVLPGITDDLPHLEALFQAAREAGATRARIVNVQATSLADFPPRVR